MADTLFLSGNTAVITGAASGIGFAISSNLAKRGLRVLMADQDADRLKTSAAAVAQLAPRGDADVLSLICDVSKEGDVNALRDAAVVSFGVINLVVNNAGIGRPCRPWSDRSAWEMMLGVNLWGVINGVQAFAPVLFGQNARSAIINLGSKQGITNPPGNAAYNISKAGVRFMTEQLAYEFRQIDACPVTAHLLVPGFTFSSMTTPATTEKPAGAWTPDQVAMRMIEGVDAGDFYIICQDNEVTWEMDQKRMTWAAGDITEGRPALSRWNPDHAGAFKDYMGQG
jgi:NAD(P)-dependent dehydrogenase (short-subunit alcohol dehydrogenase family)